VVIGRKISSIRDFNYYNFTKAEIWDSELIALLTLFFVLNCLMANVFKKKKTYLCLSFQQYLTDIIF